MTQDFFEAETVGAHWGHIPLVTVEIKGRMDGLLGRERFNDIAFPVCQQIIDVKIWGE